MDAEETLQQRRRRLAQVSRAVGSYPRAKKGLELMTPSAKHVGCARYGMMVSIITRGLD
jgi:hypothetical protein